MTHKRTIERAALGVVLIYVGLTLAVAAYLAYAPSDAPMRGVFRLPRCAMRVRMGIPCPLCFGTTTYILIWRGHWAAAWGANPFAFALFWLSVAAVFVLGWLIVSRRPMHHWTSRVSRRAWLVTALAFCVLFLINWIYLIASRQGVSPEEILARFS